MLILALGLCALSGCSERGDLREVAAVDATLPTPAPSVEPSRPPRSELDPLFEDLVAQDLGFCGVGTALAERRRARAHDALVARGPVIVPALAARLRDAGSFERGQLLRVLARLGATGSSVVVDEALAGRADALDTLAILDPVPSRAVEHAMSTLGAGAAVEGWLAPTLGRISADSTQPLETRVRAADALIAEARSGSIITRHAAVAALHPVPTREERALAVIASAVREPGHHGRHEALMALRRFEGPGAARIAAILLADDYATMHVLRLLLRLGEDARPARAALRSRIVGVNDEEAVFAIAVLAAIEPNQEDRSSTRRLLRMLRPEHRTDSRLEAARAIGAVASRADLPRLERLQVFYQRVDVGDALLGAIRQIRRRHGMPMVAASE